MTEPTEPMFRFREGADVRVLDREARGHVRTPAYVRAKRGLVTSVVGAFPDPERLAYREPAPPRPLYEVTFAHEEVWGPEDQRAAAGRVPGDRLRLDLYEHWLAPAEEEA